LLPMAQGLAGGIYGVAAATLGVVLVVRGLRLLRNHDRSNARSMYLFSMLYLALLFLALAVDRSVGA